MSNIQIITDSTNDLTPGMLAEMNVAIVPLYVTFRDRDYKDGVDITPQELFRLVKEKGFLPKTAAPSPGDFTEVFKTYVEQGKDVLYIGISSQISATIRNALLAAQEFPKGRIEIVDSLNLSSGIGSLVRLAWIMNQKGVSLGKLAEKVRNLVPKVQVSFVIDTLEYLYKGGRCNALQRFMGSLFHIHPIVQVTEGKMILAENIRGKMRKAVDIMLEKTIEDKDNIGYDTIIITGSEGSEEEAKYLKSKLLEHTGIENIYLTQAGCVISSHCGPRTIGIIYVRK
ncbi:DegV family protein [Zhaonella formicivorans]|uniref:DegV family protein n=1 Tax=Zhaonella formicivorans TaxID=2528593 RepID=UPI0010D64C9D|nr:DegV family protein [Zhaonella formicivorans]